METEIPDVVRLCFSTNILNIYCPWFYRIASPSTRFTLLSTWLRLVVGLAGLYLHFGCWTLADASNHQELDPPLAQRLFTSSSTKSLPTPLAIMLNLIPDMHRPSDGQIELSPEQNQLIEHIFLAGLNASDYLLNVLEPRLYREGWLPQFDWWFAKYSSLFCFNYFRTLYQERRSGGWSCCF